MLIAPGNAHTATLLKKDISIQAQWSKMIGSFLAGALPVIVANTNSLYISLAKPKTNILIFSLGGPLN